MKLRAWHVALSLVVLAGACTLNPQPLPPGETASKTRDAGFGQTVPEPGPDAGRVNSDEAGAGIGDASTEASPPPPLDGGGVPDASEVGDAATDAASDAADAAG